MRADGTAAAPASVKTPPVAWLCLPHSDWGIRKTRWRKNSLTKKERKKLIFPKLNVSFRHWSCFLGSNRQSARCTRRCMLTPTYPLLDLGRLLGAHTRLALGPERRGLLHDGIGGGGDDAIEITDVIVGTTNQIIVYNHNIGLGAEPRWVKGVN